MAGADYDYTKSLLPAGNGAIHAMSGGGYGQPQEGGVIDESKLDKFNFEGITKDTITKGLLTDGSVPENNEVILTREILKSLFTRFSNRHKFIKYKDFSNFEVSLNIKNTLNNIVLAASYRDKTVKGSSDETITITAITFPPAEKPEFIKIRAEFLIDIIKIITGAKLIGEGIDLKINFKESNIPQLVSIAPTENVIKLKLDHYTELAKKYNFLQVGGAPEPEAAAGPDSASSVPPYGTHAEDILKEINTLAATISPTIDVLKASAANLPTDGSQQALIQKVTDLETHFTTVTSTKNIDYYIEKAKDINESEKDREEAVTNLKKHRDDLKLIRAVVDSLQKEIDVVLGPAAPSPAGTAPPVPAGTAIVPSEQTITVLNKPYTLMIPVKASDFDNLDKPEFKVLKELHHDFGLDYIKDGAQKANEKKAEFVNNLEKCQTVSTSLTDEDCNKFRGIVSEVIQNIVGMDNIPVVAGATGTAAPGTPLDYEKEAIQLQADISALAEKIMKTKSPLETKIANIKDDAKRTAHEASLKTIVDTFNTNYPVTPGTDPTKAVTDPLVLIAKDASKNQVDAITKLTAIKAEIAGIDTELGKLTISVDADLASPVPDSTARNFVTEHTGLENEVSKLRENITALQKEIGDSIAAAPAGAAAGAAAPAPTKEQKLQKELEAFNKDLQSFYDNADPSKPNIKIDDFLAQIKADIADASKAEAAIKAIIIIRDTLAGKVKALEAIKGKLPAKVHVGGGVKKGIPNVGNTCWFNSATQLLNQIIPLRDSLINNDFGEPDMSLQETKDYIENLSIDKYNKLLKQQQDSLAEYKVKWGATFTQKTSKTKEDINTTEMKPKIEEIKDVFNKILPEITKNPDTLQISQNVIKVLILVNKNMLLFKDRIKDELLKKLITKFKSSVKTIDEVKDVDASIIENYNKLIKKYNEYLEIKKNYNVALSNTDQSQPNPKTITEEIAKYTTIINSWPKGSDGKPIVKINSIAKTMNALKAIITELNKDDGKKKLDREFTKEHQETLRVFREGEFQQCTHEDAADYVSRVILPLFGCYKVTNDLLAQLNINKTKNTTCIADESVKNTSNVIVPLLDLELDIDPFSTTGKINKSTIQTLINKLKSDPITVDDYEACRELADDSVLLSEEITVSPENRYLIIGLKRSAEETIGGVKKKVFSEVETIAEYEITVNDKKFNLVGGIIKTGDPSGGHYVFKTYKEEAGERVRDTLFNDGDAESKDDGYNIDTNATIILYKRKDPMTGGKRRLGLRGRTLRTSRIAPEQSTGGKRTLKARVVATTVQVLLPGPAQTKRRHLKARTTQSRTERSRVSGRLPIRRAAGK